MALLAYVLLLFVAPRADSHNYRWLAGSASSYCTGSITADGSRPRWGTVAASYSVPMGAWVEVMGPRSALRILGRRYFRVTDRGAPGYFLIDLWTRYGCGWSYNSWGRRNVSIRVVPRHHLWRGKPDGGYRWRP